METLFILIDDDQKPLQIPLFSQFCSKSWNEFINPHIKLMNECVLWNLVFSALQVLPTIYSTPLSNLWWIPDPVFKCFITAMKSGSWRQFKQYHSTCMWVSIRLPFTGLVYPSQEFIIDWRVVSMIGISCTLLLLKPIKLVTTKSTEVHEFYGKNRRR